MHSTGLQDFSFSGQIGGKLRTITIQLEAPETDTH